MTKYPYVFGDPVLYAIEFLKHHGFNALAEEPDFTDYDTAETVVLVQDGGGSGVRVEEISRSLLTFEVRAKSRGEASEVASRVEALVRSVWEQEVPGIYYKGALGRPAWSPEIDRRIPAYIWTVEIWFRGEPLKF